MSFCTKCGNRLGEGVRFCTNCGAPVGIAAAVCKTGNYTGQTGSNAGKTQTSSGRLRIRKYYIGEVDYRKLNNVCLASKPSQHTLFHVAGTIMEIITLIYLVVVGIPLIPEMLEKEGTTDIGFILDVLPETMVVFVLSGIFTIIYYKIRFEILHSLPKGFDRWKIRNLLKWKVFGFESLKITFCRLVRKEDINYPELGIGTDEEGNYYAFRVSGEDVGQYPYIKDVR